MSVSFRSLPGVASDTLRAAPKYRGMPFPVTDEIATLANRIRELERALAAKETDTEFLKGQVEALKERMSEIHEHLEHVDPDWYGNLLDRREADLAGHSDDAQMRRHYGLPERELFLPDKEASIWQVIRWKIRQGFSRGR